MVIPFRAGLDRTRIPNYSTAYLDQLRESAARVLVFDRLVTSKPHTANLAATHFESGGQYYSPSKRF